MLSDLKLALSVEHSENKIGTYIENEARPGVLQPSFQQIFSNEKSRQKITELKRGQWPLLCAFGVLAKHTFFERWT